MNLKITNLLFTFLIFAGQVASAQTELPTKQAIARLEKDVPDLMQKAGIPGVSIGLIRDGKLVWTGTFGVMNADTRKPVTKETVFEAASLSKCVFAYQSYKWWIFTAVRLGCKERYRTPAA